jgi:hypothetical protein
MVVSASFGVHLCCFWWQIVDGAEGRENSQDFHNSSTVSHLNASSLVQFSLRIISRQDQVGYLVASFISCME